MCGLRTGVYNPGRAEPADKSTGIRGQNYKRFTVVYGEILSLYSPLMNMKFTVYGEPEV